MTSGGCAALIPVAIIATMATLTVPASASAQDHATVTFQCSASGGACVAPPPLTGSDCTVDYSQTISIGSQSTGAGANKTTFNPVLIVHPLSSDIGLLAKALVSGTAFNSAKCDLYHAGSSTPYFTVSMQLVVVRTLQVAYDSAAGVATENIELQYGGLQYSAPGTQAGTTTNRMLMPAVPARTLMIAGKQVRLTTLNRPFALSASNATSAGPPIAAFVTFSSNGTALGPDAGVPSWAGKVSSTTSAFAFDLEAALDIGAQSTGTGVGKTTFNPIGITKPIGSVTAQMSAFWASSVPSTSITLADRVGRLTYRFTFCHADLRNENISSQTGKETLSLGYGAVRFDDLLRGTSVVLSPSGNTQCTA